MVANRREMGSALQNITCEIKKVGGEEDEDEDEEEHVQKGRYLLFSWELVRGKTHAKKKRFAYKLKHLDTVVSSFLQPQG